MIHAHGGVKQKEVTMSKNHKGNRANTPVMDEAIPKEVSEVLEEVNSNEEMTETSEKVLEEPTTVTGLVTNCVRLNIRRKTNINSEIVGGVKAGDKLTINLNQSTEDWLSVTTEDGVKGFCMKQYVNIEQ